MRRILVGTIAAVACAIGLTWGTHVAAQQMYVSSPPSSVSLDLLYFGDGSDGDVTISSGTTTLTRPMQYRTLTISGTGALATAGYAVSCSVECDFSNAPAGALTPPTSNGNSGAAAGTGGTGSGIAANFLPVGASALTGGAGSTAGGAQASNATTNTGQMGGGGGASGAGGSGASGSGGANRTNIAIPTTAWPPKYVRGPLDSWIRVTTQLACGNTGQSGGGGGGDGAVSGGGGGAGGTGGSFVGVWAKSLRRGASTTAGAIRALGGNGGNGGTPASGNSGGGGAGGGAGGGVVYLVVGGLAGATATNMLNATGGTGGTGGAKSGTGTDGTGGTGGNGGLIVVFNLQTNTMTVVDNRTTVGTGPTGRTGGSGASTTMSL